MDQIFYHGCFYTPYDTAVQAVGVKNGRIVAIGTDQQLLNQADSTTQLVDLEGKRVVPGFIDSHCHLLLAGLAYEQLDLHGCRSPREMVERGRAYIKERQLPAGTWVVGGGYDHNQFDEPVLPDGRVAEAISSVHPVMFERVCGHVGAANPLALRLAGFDESTVIEGGVLDKDSKGRLTGVLRETALDQFKLKIPLPDVDTLARALQRAIAVANQDGVTSVHSDDVMTVPVEDFLKAVDQLKEKGQFHIRIWEEFEAARPPLLRKLISRGQRTGDGDQWYRCGNLKLLLDGSLGARTASLREPYCDDPENKGIQVYLQEDLEEMVRLAHENHLQIAFHAIGDRAVEQALTAVEKVQHACPSDLRHRVVHCQIADPSFFPRMAALRPGGGRAALLYCH